MGESDLDRHLAAGAGAPADPDDVGEPGSPAPEPGSDGPAGRAAQPGPAVQLGPATEPGPAARVGSVARNGSPSPPVADRDLVEAVADFVQDLVDGGDSCGSGPAADDGLHGDGDRPAGEEMSGSTDAG